MTKQSRAGSDPGLIELCSCVVEATYPDLDETLQARAARRAAELLSAISDSVATGEMLSATIQLMFELDGTVFDLAFEMHP